MKKLFLLLSATFLLASCSVNKAFVKTEYTGSEIKAYTAADLQVDEQMIQFAYYPTNIEGKTLNPDQLVQNAIFKAIENRNYDTMVQVRYYLNVRYGLFGRRVTRVDICGFPAKYIGFRTPTDTDRENAKAYDCTNIVTSNAPKAPALRK